MSYVFRALHALMLHVPRALRALVSHVSLVLRVLMPHVPPALCALGLTCLVPYILSFLTCLLPYGLLFLTCLVPYMFSFLTCLLSNRWRSHVLRVLRAPVPYVLHSSLISRYLCLTCSHASLALRIKCSCALRASPTPGVSRPTMFMHLMSCSSRVSHLTLAFLIL